MYKRSEQKEETSIRKRIRFKDKNWWKDLLSSDETKVNAELIMKNLQPIVKHGGDNVILWGCISSTGVDEMAYLKILKDNLHKSAENQGIGDSFKFYQNNDPKHKA